MKSLLFLLLLSCSITADSLRTWTHLETGKTIQAKIIDKDEARVQIETAEGKSHWIDLTKLIGADRKYVEEWKKPSNEPQPITAKTLEKHETFKKITVTAKTGDVPAVLMVKNLEVEGGNSCYIRMKANASETWTGTVRNRYEIVLVAAEDFTLARLTSGEVEEAEKAQASDR